MLTFVYKIRWIACCLAASILVHLLFMYAVRLSGLYELTAPVTINPGIVVELAGASVHSKVPFRRIKDAAEGSGADSKKQAAMARASNRMLTASPEQPLPEPDVDKESNAAALTNGTLAKNDSQEALVPEVMYSPVATPLKSGTFLASKYEKLTYLLSIFGTPVGSAELEAIDEDGQVSIKLRIRSNELFSTIYPVDNLVETRHVDERYIMTKIRQREGSYSNDALFTVNLQKRRISWIEPLNGNSRQLTVSGDAPLDTLSGIYSLRNRSLAVGQIETLHIFDSETYAAVPVEILRSEEIRLANLSTVDTLVIRPLQKTAGMFRHSGDVLIWLTNDSYKVPVKLVTTIPYGTVTAELVAAETQ